MNLEGKTAVITGGAIRIGRALTLALANEGCQIFIHYGRSADPAQETREEARALGVEAEIHQADLANDQEVKGIIPAAAKRFGHVDILINNAAIFPETDSFRDTDTALWNKLFNINLRAPFSLSQAFARQLPNSTQGKIINILDARGRRTGQDHFAYRLAKGGLWQMTEMLALELAPDVTVNGVALGAILPPPGAAQTYLDQMAQTRVPLKRAGSPELVAENVRHLLRQDFLTGVIIPIDGGQFL